MGKKKEWFIAVGDIGGEFAGNPLAFIASDLYGPYTKKQVEQAEKIGESFPDETFAVYSFFCPEPKPFNELLQELKTKVADSIEFQEHTSEKGDEG